MIKERKKLILFDIDGTLYNNDKMEVPNSTKIALENLKEIAHLGIATGRAEFMLYSIEDIIELFDDFVLINGQYIKSNGKIVYKSPIDYKSLHELILQLEDEGVAYGFQGSTSEAISKIDEKVLESFTRLGLKLPPIDMNFYHYNEVFQAWAFCDEKQKNKIAKAHPLFQFIKWMDVGYDILPIASNKGLGMKKLAKYLNILPEDIIAFGDGDNDFEMLRDAGIGIAMGNASDKVKAIASYITEPVGNDGIYKALQYYKLLK